MAIHADCANYKNFICGIKGKEHRDPNQHCCCGKHANKPELPKPTVYREDTIAHRTTGTVRNTIPTVPEVPPAVRRIEPSTPKGTLLPATRKTDTGNKTQIYKKKRK